MSTVPALGQPSASPVERYSPSLQTAAPELLQALHLLYGDHRGGFIELSAIEGDPAQRTTVRFHQHWCDLQRHSLIDIEEQARDLIKRYGNVYVSRGVYAKRGRFSPLLPSRLVFLDDAPEHPPVPYTFSIKTSVTSRHAYYLLDRPYPSDVIKDLQRRAAYALGADGSGADLQQLVRLPEAYNTKGLLPGQLPSDGYLVGLESSKGPTYPLEQLQEAWSPVPQLEKADIQYNGESYEELYDLGVRLLQSKRVHAYQRSDRSQLSKVLQQQRITLIVSKGADNSDSVQRVVMAHGLAYRGHPDTEIIAMLLAYDWVWQEKAGRTQKDRLNDAIRVTRLARAKYKDVPLQPTKYLPPSSGIPQCSDQGTAKNSASPRGRPKKLTAEELYAYYEAHIDAGRVCFITRKQAAQDHNVSVRTIDTLETTLRKEGRLQRHTAKNRMSSWIELLPHGCTANNDVYEETQAHPENTFCSKHNLSLGSCVSPLPNADLLSTEPEFSNPIPLSPTPWELVEEAIAACDNLKKPVWKVLKKYIQMNYPDHGYCWPVLRSVFEQWQLEHASVKELGALKQRYEGYIDQSQGGTLSSLRKKLHDDTYVDDPAQQNNSWKYWAAQVSKIQAELRRRVAPILAAIERNPLLTHPEDEVVSDPTVTNIWTTRQFATVRHHVHASPMPDFDTYKEQRSFEFFAQGKLPTAFLEAGAIVNRAYRERVLQQLRTAERGG